MYIWLVNLVSFSAKLAKGKDFDLPLLRAQGAECTSRCHFEASGSKKGLAGCDYFAAVALELVQEQDVRSMAC